MNYSMTVFDSPRWWDEKNRYVYDNKTHRKLTFDSWDNFAKFFRTLSERELKGKQDAQLISPAVFEAGSTRSNKSVLSWAGWAAVDVDNHTFDGELEDALRTRFGHWSYICYSTASSTDAQPKFRLVFRLERHIPSSQIKHFWWALNTELDSIGDKQTKDLARMYYIPATYAGANNFFYVNHANALDVDYLCAKHPYDEKRNSASFLDRLPDAWRSQIIEYRKDQLDNTDIHWSGYHDCPFWPKKIASDYQTISKEGWYRKMYQLMIALAGNAVMNKYPITAQQIADLCRQFDRDNGNWYENRPLDVEANNALEYVYKNG